MKKDWLKKERKEESSQPSAVEDCADITSRYKRYEKKIEIHNFLQLNMKNHPIIK
jgi:hypothetical protein